jgi:hypothetical protein
MLVHRDRDETITAKQRAWFKASQERTGTDPLGLDHLEEGAMTFAEAAQYSIRCFLSEAEEIAQGLERDLLPLTANV